MTAGENLGKIIPEVSNPMIWYTGDIHGQVRRVREGLLRYNVQPGDTIVMLGDLGLNYHGNARDRRRKTEMEQIAKNAGVNFFCIHGNHDMRPWHVPAMRETERYGGRGWVEDAYPHIFFARDGEVFSLEGRQCIVCGGAYSVDKNWRVRMGWTWFDDEQPSADIKRDVEAALERLDWKIDTVLTHTCPIKFTPTEAMFPGLDQSKIDKTTEQWLDTIEDRLDYNHWFCGHWHINKHAGKLHFLMENYETLEA